MEEKDCSYRSLLKFLKLDTRNDELAEMRPVKSWKTPTIVYVDLYVNAVLEVVSACNIIFVFLLMHCFYGYFHTNLGPI